MRPGDTLVGDRAFCSHAHLALLEKRGIHGLFRVHQKLRIGFGSRHGCSETGMRRRVIRRLGRLDQLVEYHKPAERPVWMSASEFARLPRTVVLREVRYRVKRPGRRTREVTLVTSLRDRRKYPARKLARMYARRWRAEGDIRDVKTTLGLDVLKCQSAEGVEREVAMMPVVYNLVGRVLRHAAKRQEEKPRRMSFADGLDWLANAAEGERVPE